ncbi:MAG TPA: hypothetical protein VHP63_07545 [candidate division Zixibacteria bacterium]|nr:hypothetical protein [candidate division Zixibacteria bacterium]
MVLQVRIILSFLILALAGLSFAEPVTQKLELTSSCRISLDIADYTDISNSLTELPIYLENPGDTILGLRIWIQLDRPDVMEFRVDSAIKFDTSGTLLSGWEFIDARSISGTGADIQITAIANTAPPPFHPGLMPQPGGLLIKLLADIYEINDPFGDSIVRHEINPFYREHLEIVISDLNWTIWEPVPFWDTVGWVCAQWHIDSTQNPPDTLGCLNWVQTPFPPWDDTAIILDTMFVLDSTKLCLNTGSVYVLASPTYLCGDLNGDSAIGNVLDLNFQVNRIFRGGPLPSPPEAADVNCDGSNGNILDLNMIISRIFRNGLSLCNGGWCP